MVRQALKDPIVYTNKLNILDIRTDRDTIGTLFVEALFNPAEDGLKLDVYIKDEYFYHIGNDEIWILMW